MKTRELNHLIVVPRIVNTVGDWYQFPLGIAYVSSSLKEAGFHVFTLNLNNIEGPVEDVLNREMSRSDIDVVLTGGLTGQYGAIRDVIAGAKQVDPEVVTIVGGGIVSSAPEEAMQALEYGDFGVIGEGDLIARDLCAALEQGMPPTEVPGLVARCGGGFRRTGGCVANVDVETLPMPDYESFGIEQLLSSVPNVVGMSEYNTLPIITSRSCPYRCTFCFHTSGQKYRQRSLDSVFAEIDYLVREFGVRFLSIQDELFGYDMEWVQGFCRRIRPYGIRWLANFRVSDVTPELVDLVKDANCAVMAFGVESADNRVLRSMRKGVTVEQTEKALELAYDAGLGIQGVLIFGDVAETVETAKTSFNWWLVHIHYELELSAVITYPGTDLYRYALSKGLISDPVQYIRDACPLVRLSSMSEEEYRWLFEQLLSLPRMAHTEPRSATVTALDRVNATIDISGDCAACGTTNQWEKARLFIRETLACNRCGRKHIAPMGDSLIADLNKTIERLIERFGKVAFWGINSYIYSLFGKLAAVRGAGVVFIDKSSLRQGVRLAGHSVQGPESIRSEGVRCVVVAVVQYSAALKTPIHQEFPEVESVLSISDLLRGDPETDVAVAGNGCS